jgi:hypothetical protein
VVLKFKCNTCKFSQIVEKRLNRCPNCNTDMHFQHYENNNNQLIQYTNNVNERRPIKNMHLTEEKKEEYANKVIAYVEGLDTDLEPMHNRRILSFAYKVYNKSKCTSAKPEKKSKK